ncbi:hypothetical protein [Algibacter aquimarinus]|uniref:Uncharacterized protein n=1 Tax=Algibacter aquimarinus TaxID=1136748 RepID=A0ABP9HAA9_9FLAO
MKTTIYLFFLISYSIFCQESIEATFVKKSPFEADKLVSVDNFGTKYYINNDVFYKKNTSQILTYNNLQLGNLETVNAFNPLKINLFYKDFNTVIILDNRLAEIFKIDFNTASKYKNVSHVSTGYDNTIWLFNQDTQLLEVFDYKTRTTRAQILQPIDNEILDLKSNYNYCYLLTKEHLTIYNYFGSVIRILKNEGYTELAESNEALYLKKGDNLFYLGKNSKNVLPVNSKNILINQFFVTNETLYIYDNETLQEFQIKIN